MKAIALILLKQNRLLYSEGKYLHLFRYVHVHTQYYYYYHPHSQTRGSIPIHWTQTPTLKYKPNPSLSDNSTIQSSGIQKHFDEQIVLYGQQTAINLINQSGSEKSLGDAFKRFVDSLSSILIKYDPNNSSSDLLIYSSDQ